MLRTMLLLATPLLLIAATCVGPVRQTAPDGPWVGEVSNDGDQPVHGVTVAGDVYYDAGELALAHGAVDACPTVLLPGERGAFSFTRADAAVPRSARPPFDARFGRLAGGTSGYGDGRGEGLHAVEVARDASGRNVTIDIENNGELALRDVRACAVARNADGSVASVAEGVAKARRDPLMPGKKMTFTFAFSEAFDGRVHVFPAGTTDAPPPPCCPAGATDWRSIDTGPFRVMLPPGWRYVPAQGIDSFVGGFEGDGMSLHFDYGWYSAGPHAGDPAYAAHAETIGGMEATIEVPLTSAGLTALYVEQVNEAGRPMSTRFALWGHALTAEQQAVALQVFRSLRFGYGALMGFSASRASP